MSLVSIFLVSVVLHYEQMTCFNNAFSVGDPSYTNVRGKIKGDHHVWLSEMVFFILLW